MASTIAPIEERRILGIGLVLIAYLLFAVIDSCAKWLAMGGMPTAQVVFVRYAGQFALIAGIFLPTRRQALVRTASIKLEVARALCLLGSTVANFIAINFLPLTVTGSINFTMPLIVCLLSIPLLGEQVGWRRWTAILIGLVGILIIVRPGTGAFHPAVLLSLAGATFGSLYFLITRKLAGVDSTSTQNFYTALIATLCMAPFAFSAWAWPRDPSGWFAFSLIGLAAFVGHQLVTVAHRFAPASVLAPFAYFQIVYMTASSWLIFSQPPDVWIFVGAPIVMASGLYIWLRERRLARPVVTELAAQD